MRVAELIMDAVFYAVIIYFLIDYIKLKREKDDNDNNR